MCEYLYHMATMTEGRRGWKDDETNEDEVMMKRSFWKPKAEEDAIKRRNGERR